MAKAYVFPGQGAQFVGMGKDLYESNPKAKELFDKANEILGYRITDIMFNCETVIFGPKLSFAVVTKEMLCDEQAAKKLARRVAVDVSVFDQTEGS